MPTLSLGEPINTEGYLTQQVNGVTIYYHEHLQTKPGHESITVRLKKFLFLNWLELEGARSTPVYEQE